MASLPAGYRVRGLEEGDLEAVTELLRAGEEAQWAEPDSSPEDTRGYLATVDLDSDSWLVTGPDELAVGFIFFDATREERWWGFGSVHPEHQGHGLGSWLLERFETRARERLSSSTEPAAVELSIGAFGREEGARSLIERAGFRWKRRFWHMSIDLAPQPDEPFWPAGIEVVGFDPSQARDVFEASEEAFRDHFDYAPLAFDQWRRRMLDRGDFDPTLWFVATQGDEIAGVSLCRQRASCGWVEILAVRRPWRRRGLGLALLRLSFAEFFRRGTRKVRLGVDSENLTGATRLYERAGMQVVREYDIFGKELYVGSEGGDGNVAASR